MPHRDDITAASRRATLLESLRETYGKSRTKDRHVRPANPEKIDSYDFSKHAAYSEVRIAKAAARTLSLASPFFRVSEAARPCEVRINGRWVINFASYDYLGLNQSEAVRLAVEAGTRDWGVSATASRLVGGERTAHVGLEKQLAEFVGTESALALVSGHATNVAIIRTLVGPGDLVLVDSLAHNSIYEGIRASGANHVSFPHNDADWVNEYLKKNAGGYGNTLVIVEGLYSMDGDTPALAHFVKVKQRHRSWLMIDEAHSIGVLGATGRGICEERDVNSRDVEIIMGTLSKSLCSCGGFVAGSESLIDLLRYKAPGFVYSVGLSAPNTAAAQAALTKISAHPEYVSELRNACVEFFSIARSLSLNTGESEGFAICPVIIGDSLRAVWVSNRLLTKGFNVLPIITPAVPDRSARLRFFINRKHRPEDMRVALEATADLIKHSSSMSVQDLAAG